MSKNVSLRGFTMGKRLLLKFLVWLTGTKFYYFLLVKIIPYIRLTTYYTKFRGDAYHAGYKLLKPGMFLLSVDDQKLTTKLESLITKGCMSHAAACVAIRPDRSSADKGIFEIREMTHTDYTYSDFFDVAKESSRVLIMDCISWDADYKKVWCQMVEAFNYAKYDIEFKFGVELLYCSELIYMADRAAHKALFGVEGNLLQCDTSDFAGLGREYISPDGLLYSKNVKCVWDSEGILTNKMGPEIEKIITGLTKV